MILTKYSAPWCAPCKALSATLETVLKDFPNIELVEVDISVTPAPSITTLPTLVLNGRRTSGAMSAQALRAWLKAAV